MGGGGRARWQKKKGAASNTKCLSGNASAVAIQSCICLKRLQNFDNAELVFNLMQKTSAELCPLHSYLDRMDVPYWHLKIL